MGLSFFESMGVNAAINHKEDEIKESFMDYADPDGKLSPDIKEALGEIFDANIDALQENIGDLDPNDPIKSAGKIIAAHFSVKENTDEVSAAIHEKTGIDMGNVTPDNKSDDITPEQMQELKDAFIRGFEGVKNDIENPKANENDQSSIMPMSESISLLAVTEIITGPSSDFLAGIVPLGAGVAMVHGEDIADRSSIEAGGEPIGAYFGDAANETAALERIQQAQEAQLAMANAPAPTDPNINNPIGGMSAPSAPSGPV